jgi:hypothetical protein
MAVQISRIATSPAAAGACPPARSASNPEHPVEQNRGRDQADIAEPAHQKLLSCRDQRRLPLRIEHQQPVQPDAGAERRGNEQQHVAGHDEQQHRRQREAQQSGETRMPRITIHVGAAIVQNHRADERHQAQHDRAQPVGIEAEADTGRTQKR